MNKHEFLERVGFNHYIDKWACKNCIFTFALDQLAYLGGDYQFQQEMEKSEFAVGCRSDFQ